MMLMEKERERDQHFSTDNSISKGIMEDNNNYCRHIW